MEKKDGAKMKTLLTVALILVPTMSFAHDVDHICAPGLVTEDGCQPATPELGLDNPEFATAHGRYWHCRRNLVVTDTVAIAQLYGQVKLRRAELGVEPMFPIVPEEFLTYWNTIPAHPELDFPGQVWRAEEQTLACEATRVNAGYIRYLLSFELEVLNLQAKERLQPITNTICCDKKKKNCKRC